MRMVVSAALIIAVAFGILKAEDIPSQYVGDGHPQTYEEYMAGVQSLPFAISQMYDSGGSGELVYLIVNASLISQIETSLVTYYSDLVNQGCHVRAYASEGGTPEDIRNHLREGYQGGLAGALLIGELPAAWFETVGKCDWEDEHFPCDLFYMDLNGYWADENPDDRYREGVYDLHTGHNRPEIFVGRLHMKSNTPGVTEGLLINNYFDKNHLYREGNLTLPHAGLVFMDDDWADNGQAEVQAMSIAISDVTGIYEKGRSGGADYRYHLQGRSGFSEGYEIVDLWAHSDEHKHEFDRSYEIFSTSHYGSPNIKGIDPEAFFSLLSACASGRFTVPDYIAGWYVFSDSYGLVSIATSKSGGIKSSSRFFSEYGSGKSVGLAFRNWFRHFLSRNTGNHGLCWSYGSVCLGDPTLHGSVWDGFSGVYGDINFDGTVNVLDCLLIANIILEIIEEPTKYQQWAADMNEDGQINIDDIILVIHRILGITTPDPEPCPDLGILTFAKVQSNKYELMLENIMEVAGVEIHLTKPLELELDTVQTTIRSDPFIFDYNTTTSEFIAVIYDTTLATIDTVKNSSILDFFFLGSGEPAILDAALSTQDASEIPVVINHQPNCPSNPSPAYGVTNQPVNVDLSWSGGDPDSGNAVTYDIYFGTSSPPPLAVSDYTNSMYDPGPLNYGCTYFWQIVAKDNYEVPAYGLEWSFATVPDTVNLYPVKDVSINAHFLYWTYNYGVTDWIRMGQNSPLIVYKYRSLIQFDLSALPSGATVETALLHLYVSNNSQCLYDTELNVYRMEHDWAEGTGSNYPTGDGATWLTSDGSTDWQGGPGAAGSGDCEQTPTGGVTIPYLAGIDQEVVISMDAGAVEEMLDDGSFGNYGFLIKDCNENRDMYGFHSSESGDQSYWPRLEVIYSGCGGSPPPPPPPENNPPSITVTAPPAGGDTADASYTITWTSSDPDTDVCTVDLYYDTNTSPGGETQIILDTADDGGYTWNTSSISEGNYYIYAVIDDAHGGVENDYSAGILTIDHPGCDAPATPTGLTGSTVCDSVDTTRCHPQIRWDSVPGATSYRVYKSLNNGPYEFLDSTTVTLYVDEGFRNGGSLKDVARYNVSAMNSCGESEMTSNHVWFRGYQWAVARILAWTPIPEEYRLFQNYPNPFNSTTRISYQLPVVSGQTSHYVTLKIYNILGQEVRMLVDESRDSGSYTVTWDGRDGFGYDVVSGIYFYRLTTGNFSETKKMVLMR